MAPCHNIISGTYVKKIYSNANPNMIYIPFFSSGDSHKTHTLQEMSPTYKTS